MLMMSRAVLGPPTNERCGAPPVCLGKLPPSDCSCFWQPYMLHVSIDWWKISVILHGIEIRQAPPGMGTISVSPP